MTDIRNKEQRRRLIERFLNAETTLKEEKLLAEFYQSNEGQSVEGENDIRSTILMTKELSNNRFSEPDMSAVAEFDKLMSGNSGEAVKQATSISRNRKRQWRSPVRTALYIGIAAIVAIVVMLRLNVSTHSEEETLTTSATSDAQNMPLADVPDTPTSSEHTTLATNEADKSVTKETETPATTASMSKKSRRNNREDKAEKVQTIGTLSIDDLCKLSETTFKDCGNVTMTNTDNTIIVTTLNADGTRSAYQLVSCDANSYTLAAME